VQTDHRIGVCIKPFRESGRVKWLSGAEDIVSYQVPGRDISKTFCRISGSGVPWVSGDGSKVVVPAGSLHEEPHVAERIGIFAAEQPSWSLSLEQINTHPGFPE
jgi:hypothetical protein